MHRPNFPVLSVKFQKSFLIPKQLNIRNINNDNNQADSSKNSLLKIDLNKSSSQSILLLKNNLSSNLFLNKYICSRNQQQKPIQRNKTDQLHYIKRKRKKWINKSVYHINSKTQHKFDNIKHNNEIAIQDDFNLNEYQNSLVNNNNVIIIDLVSVCWK